MKINLQEIILWVLLPFLNFMIWFYLAHTGNFIHPVECPMTPIATSSLQTLLDQSQKELLAQAIAAGGGNLVNSDISNNILINPQSNKCVKKTKLKTSTEDTSSHVSESSESASCKPLSMSEKTGRLYVTFEDTMEFEKYRSERLASMTVEILLKTYTDDDTAILHRDDSDEDEIGKRIQHFFCVVFYSLNCFCMMFYPYLLNE